MKKTNIYTVSILVFVGVMLVALGFYLSQKNDGTGTETYANQSYGISFTYPEDYELAETSAPDGITGTVITITEDKVALPRNGEGPTAITVSMYDGAATTSMQSLPAWIRTSPYSNFNLSSQTEPGITQVGGQDGYLYTWDGLYQGTTVVTEHAGNIIVFSVTYDGETDLEKRDAFTDLVASVRFSDPETTGTSTPAE